MTCANPLGRPGLCHCPAPRRDTPLPKSTRPGAWHLRTPQSLDKSLNPASVVSTPPCWPLPGNPRTAVASVPLCPVVCPPTPDSRMPGNLGHPCGPKPINIMTSGQPRASSLGLCEEPDVSFSSFFCCHRPLCGLRPGVGIGHRRKLAMAGAGPTEGAQGVMGRACPRCSTQCPPLGEGGKVQRDPGVPLETLSARKRHGEDHPPQPSPRCAGRRRLSELVHGALPGFGLELDGHTRHGPGGHGLWLARL